METTDKPEIRYDEPGKEMITKIGQPFDVVYYIHWWLPGSKREHRGNTRHHPSHLGVDSDGGYMEFNTVEEALVEIKQFQKEAPEHVFAVVADLRCTVRLVRPLKPSRPAKNPSRRKR